MNQTYTAPIFLSSELNSLVVFSVLCWPSNTKQMVEGGLLSIIPNLLI